MFTGLIETVGTVVEAREQNGSLRLTIRSSIEAKHLSHGESVAVSGVCLTVARIGRDSFVADVIPETLSRTTLGRARAGTRVNLERALRVGDRLGGHWVQGHVDDTARVLRAVRRGGDCRLRIAATPRIRRFLAEKGSVAIDGVSLTLASSSGAAFEVALIPETLARTTLGDLDAGDSVNVEVDLLARYLDRLIGGAPTRRAAASRPRRE